jgi:predicted RNA-binding protein with PUA-like domain
MAEAAQYWLMKTEPEAYSIHDLAREPTRTTHWDGVRNYQARNFMRAMRVGDRVLFYHSIAEPPAVVGTAVVDKTAYPDFTALDPADKHFDPKATQENPIWAMVDVKLERVFDRQIALDELRATPGLKGMELLRRGSRLSVQPVSKEHFEIVLKLAEKPESGSREPAAPTQKRAAPLKRAARSSRPPKKAKEARKRGRRKTLR